jgi:hypothetical protein
VALTSAALPRPARYADLQALCRREALTALVLLDEFGVAALEPLRVWLRLMSRARVLILADAKDVALGVVAESGHANASVLDGLAEWLRGDPASPMALLDGSRLDIVVSCEPYDAYAEVVKDRLERRCLTLLSRWQALYLAHDPSNQVLRVLDFEALRNRVHVRPWRRRRYEGLVDLGYLIAAAAASDQSTGWRPLSRDDVLTPLSTPMPEPWARWVRDWQCHAPDLLAGLPERDCPACGSRKRRPLFSSRDGFGLVECASCRSWYVPVNVDGLVERFIDRCPEAGVAARSLGQLRAGADSGDCGPDSRSLLLAAQRLLPPGVRSGKLLDVGFGSGALLEAAKAMGFETAVVADDPGAVARARADGLGASLTRERWPEGPFTVIALSGALEQASEPEQLLRRCRDRLEPDGLLALTLPNLESPLVSLGRRETTFALGAVEGDGQLNLFSPGGLRILLERAGLQLVEQFTRQVTGSGELATTVMGMRSTWFAGGDGLSNAATVFRALDPELQGLEHSAGWSPILCALARADSNHALIASTFVSDAGHQSEALAASLLALGEPAQGVPRPWGELELMPPLDRWEVLPGVSATTTARGTLMEVNGDDSAHSYQLRSPELPVPPRSDVAIDLRVNALSGLVGVGILADNGHWIIPPTSHRERCSFATGSSRHIRVVVANAQVDPRLRTRTRFVVKRGCIVVLGRTPGAWSELRRTARAWRAELLQLWRHWRREGSFEGLELVASPFGADAGHESAPATDSGARNERGEGAAWLARESALMPPFDRWEVSPGVSATTTGACIVVRRGTLIEVRGDDSAYNLQLVSPELPVPPRSAVAIDLGVDSISGRVGVGILGDDGRWIVPPTSEHGRFSFATRESRHIKVVVANAQVDPGPRMKTHFVVELGRIAVLDRRGTWRRAVQAVLDWPSKHL